MQRCTATRCCHLPDEVACGCIVRGIHNHVVLPHQLDCTGEPVEGISGPVRGISAQPKQEGQREAQPSAAPFTHLIQHANGPAQHGMLLACNVRTHAPPRSAAPPALAGVNPSRCVSTWMLLFSARQASAADSALCIPTVASLRAVGMRRQGSNSIRTPQRHAPASRLFACIPHTPHQPSQLSHQPPHPSHTPHLWMICRWMLLNSTVSLSTMPSLPTPAAAR